MCGVLPLHILVLCWLPMWHRVQWGAEFLVERAQPAMHLADELSADLAASWPPDLEVRVTAGHGVALHDVASDTPVAELTLPLPSLQNTTCASRAWVKFVGSTPELPAPLVPNHALSDALGATEGPLDATLAADLLLWHNVQEEGIASDGEVASGDEDGWLEQAAPYTMTLQAESSREVPTAFVVGGLIILLPRPGHVAPPLEHPLCAGSPGAVATHTVQYFAWPLTPHPAFLLEHAMTGWTKPSDGVEGDLDATVASDAAVMRTGHWRVAPDLDRDYITSVMQNREWSRPHLVAAMAPFMSAVPIMTGAMLPVDRAHDNLRKTLLGNVAHAPSEKTAKSRRRGRGFLPIPPALVPLAHSHPNASLVLYKGTKESLVGALQGVAPALEQLAEWVFLVGLAVFQVVGAAVFSWQVMLPLLLRTLAGMLCLWLVAEVGASCCGDTPKLDLSLSQALKLGVCGAMASSTLALLAQTLLSLSEGRTWLVATSAATVIVTSTLWLNAAPRQRRRIVDGVALPPEPVDE